MILIAELRDTLLNIRAYSYSDSELDVVNSFLRNRNFEFNRVAISRDRHDRKGFLFTIIGILQIQRFENILGITFRREKKATTVTFNPDSTGEPYCCLRIGKVAWEKGCQDITAEDDFAAFLKCAFLANEKNWFGVEYERGQCRR